MSLLAVFLVLIVQSLLICISKVTSECAKVAKCECIVDIGAGLGHLARTLAYNYGLCVVCLEQDESLSEQAKYGTCQIFKKH